MGALMSIMTNNQSYEENVREALKSLERFSEETYMSPELYSTIQNFLQTNYNEVYSQIDEKSLINQLVPHLKEELIYAQYGKIIYKFSHFFENLSNLDCLFDVVQTLKFLKVDKG